MLLSRILREFFFFFGEWFFGCRGVACYMGLWYGLDWIGLAEREMREWFGVVREGEGQGLC